MPSDFNEKVVGEFRENERDTIYAGQKEVAPPFIEYEKNAAPRVVPSWSPTR